MKQTTPSLARRVFETLGHLGLRSGDRLILGLSGGPDSVALLDLLARAIPKECGARYRLTIAHLCHLIRPESRAEKPFLKKLCRRYHCPLSWKAVRVPRLPETKKAGLEAGGRLARHHFFAEVLRKTKARGVLLAHHRNDRTETFLDRLLTGGSLETLDALEPFREITLPHDGKKLPLYRPLLDCDKSELLAHLQEQDLPFLTDTTNTSPHHRRNRIRHELLPFLKTFNPAIEERLLFLGTQGKTLQKTVAVFAEEIAAQLFSGGLFGPELSLEIWKKQPSFLQEMLLARFVQEPLGRTLTHRHLAALSALCQKDQGSLELPHGYQAQIFRERLLLLAPLQKKRAVRIPKSALKQGKSKSWVWEGMIFTADWSRPLSHQPQLFDRAEETFRADAETLRFPLTLRRVLPEDTFAPFGSTKKITVLEFLKKQSLPATLRERMPLLLDATGTALWLPTLRRSRHALWEKGLSFRLRLTPSLPF